MTNDTLYNEAILLLKQLITTESISKNEDGTATLIAQFFYKKNIPTKRFGNNIIVQNKWFDETKKSIVLHGHHDTVKPNAAYTYNPFEPIVIDDKLYGLGSNDAGGALVSLIATFLYFYEQQNLHFNIVLVAVAEEEISGINGIQFILPHLQNIEVGIVGEPTLMQMAIAEKGLIVLDCVSKGIAGHAARNEGDNAIYKAMKDIEWFKNFSFPNTSILLGAIKMSVTLINAGTQHNIIPHECRFVVDVRTTDAYTNEEVLAIISQQVSCYITPRSLKLQPSFIPINHPLVLIGQSIGLQYFGSPTLSDQALMPFKTIKIGPGDSARSHTANEFIYLQEIKNGIKVYIKLLNTYLIN